jgi:5-methylcytosine-specific restriction endonuclease McrA
MYANLFTRDLRKQGYVNENSICLFCSSKSELQIDHIVPISKGGANSIDNVQILCRPCNRKKSDHE